MSTRKRSTGRIEPVPTLRWCALRVGAIAALCCFAGAGCKRQSEGARSSGSAPSSTAAPAAGASSGGGAAHKDKGPAYELSVKPPAESAVGTKVAARVELVPKKPYKVNMEYPLRLTIKAPKSAQPAKLVMGSKDAAEMTKRKVLLEPRFQLASAGKHRFEAEFRFSVCTEQQCELKSEKLTWVATAR